MALTKVSYAMIEGAAKNVLDFGADPTGTTDSTAAIQAACNGGGLIYIPLGTYVMSDYVNVESNSHITIDGTILIKESTTTADYYPGGFNVYIKTNVLIDGSGTFNCENLIDVADSVWLTNFGVGVNAVGFAPHISIHGSTFCTVRGINFYKTQGGIWVHNAAEPASPDFTFTPIPGIAFTEGNTIDSVNAQFVINASHAMRQQLKCKIINSYCYKSGDGGMYMQFCKNGLIDNNIRVSSYGDGSDYMPATLKNDGQGISIEACNYTIISNNQVMGFIESGIDVKRDCTDILVIGNLVKDCQVMSIMARGGDTIYGSNTSISIIGNVVKNHGYLHDSNSVWLNYSLKGAIHVTNTYSCYVKDNTITGVNSTYGGNPIFCSGVDITQLGFWSDSPVEVRIAYTEVVVQGNTVNFPEFRTNYNDNPTGFEAANCELSGIKVIGLWGKCDVNNNTLLANLFPAGRFSSFLGLAGIEVNADGASIFGESGIQSCSVSNNTIFGWNGGGIYVTGGTIGYTPNLNLVIDANLITALPGYGIYVRAVAYVSATGNSVYDVGNVTSSVNRNAVQFVDCANAVFSSNTVRKGIGTSYPECVVCQDGNLFSNSNVLQAGSINPTGPAITLVGTGALLTANEGTDYRVNN
jgi:hypothetical protein